MNRTLVSLVLLLVLIFCSTLGLAQTQSKGDTLIIGPLNSKGEAQGALNEAIKGDTTVAGARAHTVYKLERNEQYILTEVIQADFPLVLVADAPDKNNRPPIVRCGLKEDGSSVNRWWVLFNGATFKNIWMSGVNLDGTGPIDWISMEVNGANHRYVYDGCIIEFPYTWWSVFADWGLNNTYILENCICQYIGNPAGATWNGAVFTGGTMDTVIERNNTFFDFGCFAFNGQTWYLEVDHNTFVNCMLHPINSHTKVIGKYTNNLFVNCHAFSDDQDEIRRHHDCEMKGLMNYAEIQWNARALDSLYGPGGAFGKTYDPNGDGHLTEGELVWELKNNDWYYTKPITDYWAQFSQVSPNPWMNHYNQAMFDSSKLTKANWVWNLKQYIWADSAGVIVPNPSDFSKLHVVDSTVVPVTHEVFKFYTEQNTMHLDPGITNMKSCDSLMAVNCTNIRTSQYTGTTTPSVPFHNVADYLAFTWPLDYDLSYSNATLKTAGTDGKPIGSGQWWSGTTDVEIPTLVPMTFALDQNFPNPFNPSTQINYAVPTKSFVTLKVYNVLGQVVSTLISGQLQAGNYTATFDGSKLATGVYIYRLEADGASITKKLVLLK
jgi:hypothetical protein